MRSGIPPNRQDANAVGAERERTNIFLTLDFLSQCFTPDIEWVKPLSPFGNETVCLCNPYYGFSGSDCTAYTSKTYVAACITIGMAAVSLWCFGTLLWDAFRLWRLGKLKLNSAGTTMFFTTIESVLLIVFQFMFVATLFQPTEADKFDPNNAEGKYGSQEIAARYVFGTILLFGIVSSLNVSLYWWDIVSSTSKMSASSTTTMIRYGKFVVGLELIVAVAVVPLLVLSQFFYLSLVTIPFLIFFVVTYSYGAVRMTRLLQSASDIGKHLSSPGSNQKATTRKVERANRAITLVKQTAYLVVGFGLYAFVFGVLYAVITVVGSKKFQDPAHVVSVPLFFNQQIFVGFTGMAFAVTRYVHLSISGAFASTESSSAAATSDASSTRTKKQLVVPGTQASGVVVSSSIA